MEVGAAHHRDHLEALLLEQSGEEDPGGDRVLGDQHAARGWLLRRGLARRPFAPRHLLRCGFRGGLLALLECFERRDRALVQGRRRFPRRFGTGRGLGAPRGGRRLSQLGCGGGGRRPHHDRLA